MSLPRLHILTTVPLSLATLLRGQPAFLADTFDVTLVSSPGDDLRTTGEREGVAVRGISMSRRIAPIADLRAIGALYRHFRSTRPTIVQTYTPKAGLVGMLAATLAGVPNRVHGIVGMPLMVARGHRRLALALTERLTYTFATALTCNSHGLRDWVRTHLTGKEVSVIGHGSINGVDTDYFRPYTHAQRAECRTRLGLDSAEVVFVFVGRLVPDKGVEDLLAAFNSLRSSGSSARLLLVGDEEPDLGPLSAESLRLMKDPGIVRLPWADDVRNYYAAADVLVLPSYREGLPNTLLEAAAMGLPAIASDINGCNEVVHHERSGLLIEPGKRLQLLAAMRRLAAEDARPMWGEAGRRHVCRQFDQAKFCRTLTAYYQAMV